MHNYKFYTHVLECNSRSDKRHVIMHEKVLCCNLIFVTLRATLM